MNTITKLQGSRFLSRHDSGALVYHDGRHKVIKVKVEGGTMELILALRDEKFYPQMISFITPSGNHIIIDL